LAEGAYSAVVNWLIIEQVEKIFEPVCMINLSSPGVLAKSIHSIFAGFAKAPSAEHLRANRHLTKHPLAKHPIAKPAR
jgi:hypothetical protein